MAKTATAKSASDEPKKKKKNAAATSKPKVKAKAKAKKEQGSKADTGKNDRAGKAKSKTSEGFEGIAKFVDHPMVADLLAAGALAAVAAIAEHQMNKNKDTGSSKMVKSVGKAAATAMGRKLMSDIGAITTAATDAAKKA